MTSLILSTVLAIAEIVRRQRAEAAYNNTEKQCKSTQNTTRLVRDRSSLVLVRTHWLSIQNNLLRCEGAKSVYKCIINKCRCHGNKLVVVLCVYLLRLLLEDVCRL